MVTCNHWNGKMWILSFWTLWCVYFSSYIYTGLRVGVCKSSLLQIWRLYQHQYYSNASIESLWRLKCMLTFIFQSSSSHDQTRLLSLLFTICAWHCIIGSKCMVLLDKELVQLWQYVCEIHTFAHPFLYLWFPNMIPFTSSLKF